ncbi:MAG: ThiF family adenylyltransferase [Candidatus Kuenenbacteria bacterium]
MQYPLKEWLKNSWPYEKEALKKIQCVIDEPQLLENTLSVIFVNIKVDIPAKGPVYAVRKNEKIMFLLEPNFPYKHPKVLLRHDFPSVPHLGSRKELFREICLTRNNTDDWWNGKTLVDVIIEVYHWLCDAAAGMLVKDDDPFEPLIARGTTPVEVSIKNAKNECKKSNGAWLTTSQCVPVKNGTSHRFLVGVRGGEVKTQVWYQEKEQSSLWIDRPTNIDELLDMISRIDLDPQRIRYWIDRSRTTQLLLVFGIRRPKMVLGKSSAEEWVAFELKRKMPNNNSPWEIQAHLALESFSTSIAALTSGFKEQAKKKIVFIGVGALGSEIAECLARSGTVELGIVDNDILLPHNLARHTLGSQDIGEYKAEAIAKKFNLLYKNDICIPISENILNLSNDKLLEILKDAHCAIDCSASAAVQCRLSDLLPKNIPVVSVYQINAGVGTVLLFTPSLKNTPIDMLEASFITHFRNNPIVSQWLLETGESISIGGGCRSISSKIASSTVKFGAGWLADKILRYLNNNQWPTTSFAEMLQYDFNGSGQIFTHHLDIMASSIIKNGNWTVIVANDATEQVVSYSKSAFPNETGGILIGRIDRQRQIAFITEAWKAPDDSSATKTGFSRGFAGLSNKVAMLESDTKDYLSYVGEWHSHPHCATGLSSIDSDTAKRMAKELESDRIPAICLITNGKNNSAHVVER